MKSATLRIDLVFKYFIAFAILTMMIIAAAGCSSSKENIKNKISENEKVFIFTDSENNDWKVLFENDKIKSAERNGKKLSENEIKKNEEIIFDELKEISFNHFDKEIKIDIDMKGLSESMEQLRKNLKDIDIEINFDKDEFKKEIEKLKKDLDENKFELDKELQKDLKELEENLKDLDLEKHKLKIHLNNLNEDLSKIPSIENKIKINIPPIPKVDLTEINKIAEFVKLMKKELVKDNLINENDEDFDVVLKPESLVVNGKEVPQNLFGKYKSLYEDHFNKELAKNFTFRSN